MNFGIFDHLDDSEVPAFTGAQSEARR